MTSDLLPCPFCGGLYVEVTSGFHEYWVVCKDCAGSSRMCGTRELAVTAWNTRPAPALPEIVATAKAWVAAEKTCDEYCFHSVAQRAYARARFFSLIAAHAADVAKVLEPFAMIIEKIKKQQSLVQDGVPVSASAHISKFQRSPQATFAPPPICAGE